MKKLLMLFIGFGMLSCSKEYSCKMEHYTNTGNVDSTVALPSIKASGKKDYQKQRSKYPMQFKVEGAEYWYYSCSGDDKFL